jgi:hypothetical protein
MKKSYLYALLFGFPGFFLSLVIAFALIGAASGFLWLYVFGDNPWPGWTGMALPLLLVGVFLLLWTACIVAGFRKGKTLEQEPGLNRRHLLVSAVLTLAPLLLIVLHQLRVGNLDPPSASLVCGDFCREQGYSASGLSPQDAGDRVCTCYGSGQDALSVPLESLLPGK